MYLYDLKMEMLQIKKSPLFGKNKGANIWSHILGYGQDYIALNFILQ
ncbi:hypothetical protein UMN179_00112 [Gallibacterium anatis UMN179]|uniref:Uncharacterized protein n=1 Tax=Gallibacterium anatis (strain UMN179) TaxID=1005058 RepID=F4HAB7_GALAU|nr:hypothetical protein UMN179_00112 [Gallibacterium anatis UMN179]